MVSARNTIVVRVDGDVDAFRRQMQAAGHEIQAFERGAASSTQAEGISFGRLAASISVGTLAAQGLSAAAGELGGFLRDSVTAASDMAETQSKLTAVFGTSAVGLREWGQEAASTLGMSRQQALEAAATIGNFGQALGLSREKAVEMSPAIVQLAADLASFNNANPQETLLALRSGLAGETEPMRRFGVAINATTVEAKALELGLEKVNGVFTEGAKVQARYALIMEQTKTAQGDFARTSDGLANSSRTLLGTIADLRAEVGEQLAPALADVVRELNAFLKSADGKKSIEDLAAAMGSLARATLSVGEAFVWSLRRLDDFAGGVARVIGFLEQPIRFKIPGTDFEIDLGAPLGSLGPNAERRRLMQQPGAGMEGADFSRGGPPASSLPALGSDASPFALRKLQQERFAAEVSDALREAGKEAKSAGGSLGELARRADEAFEITAVRDLQLAHKAMEEAEVAAAAAIKERTAAEQALAEQQRAYIGILNALAQRNVSFAPGAFENIARAGGLIPIGEFTNITDQDGNPIPRSPGAPASGSSVTVNLGGDLVLEGVP